MKRKDFSKIKKVENNVRVKGTTKQEMKSKKFVDLIVRESSRTTRYHKGWQKILEQK